MIFALVVMAFPNLQKCLLQKCIDKYFTMKAYSSFDMFLEQCTKIKFVLLGYQIHTKRK